MTAHPLAGRHLARGVTGSRCAIGGIIPGATLSHGGDPMAESRSDVLLKVLSLALIVILVVDFTWVISVAVSSH